MSAQAGKRGTSRPSAEPLDGRWSVVVAYASVVAVTQMLWLTFAPITTDVARDFDVSKTAVGLLALVFPLFYVLLAIPAGIALDRWFRGSLAAGAVLTALAGCRAPRLADVRVGARRSDRGCSCSTPGSECDDEDRDRIPP